MVDQTDGLLSVEEVARRLNIKRDTVYAYVSRGLLTRRNNPGSRESRFDAIDVERLAAQGRNTSPRLSQPLVFESALTTVYEGEPYYRGYRVNELALTHTFESVAALLWGDELLPSPAFLPDLATVEMLRRVDACLPSDALTIQRLRALLPAAVTMDPLHHDLRRRAVVGTVQRLMPTVIEALPQLSELDPSADLESATEDAPSIAARLWSRLSPVAPSRQMIYALNAALVVAADHDLAARSTLVARIAASVHIDIYSVIIASIHASGGFVQGASSLAIESYLDALNGRSSVTQVLGDRLRLGQGLPGFGHRTYPDGDPRAATLLSLLLAEGGARDRAGLVTELLEIQKRRGLPPPNIGFAIASLSYLGGMPRGAGDVIFDVGRMAGWVGHAIEQYAADEEVPRQASIYVGPDPGAIDS